MFSTGRASDPPAPAGTYAIDAITAYSAFEGALAALLHRERTGEGQLVTVNMLDSAIAVQMQELSVFTVGKVPQHRGTRRTGIPTFGRPMACSRRPTATSRSPCRACARSASCSTCPKPPPWTRTWTGTPAATRSPRWCAPGSLTARRASGWRCSPSTGSGLARLLVRRSGQGPAGRAQRLPRQLRPPDGRPGDHARLPLPVQRDRARGLPGAPLAGEQTREILAELGRGDAYRRRPRAPRRDRGRERTP